MTASWPETLPAQADRHAYQEVPQPAAVRFDPENGPPIARRRSTVQLSTATFAFVLTAAQVETFESFVKDELAGGVLSFTIVHPRRDTLVTAQFSGDPPYRIAWLAPDAYTLTFTALVRG